MRFPLPERFKLRDTVIFIIVVAVAQRFEGTDVTFSVLTALYVALFAFAFNVGGGLYFLAGAYIFFNGFLSAIFGIVYKIFVGEPGNSNLLEPNVTMEVYCLGMAGMLVAAALSRRLIPRQGLFANMAVGDSMKQAALGCFILGALIQVGTGGGAQTGASVSSALGQINHFPQMAIILGTVYEIQHSKGKRSSNWIVWVAGLWLFFFGVIAFSKEGMFISLFSWLIPAVVLRFDFSRKQIVGGLIVGFIVIHYLVPFSQYGRTLRTEGGGTNAAGAFELLSHPERTRQLSLAKEGDQDDAGAPHYYNDPEGLADREQMLAIDDALINYTDQGNYRGIQPTILAFENIIPHFIWHDKPGGLTGNDYAHELDLLSEDDFTTGISFSPAADAYHQAGFLGVLLIIPFVTFILFIIADTLAGDTRKSPWGLLFVALSSHLAPEGLISGAVYLATFGAFAVVLIALSSQYLLPIAANLLTGNSRTRVRRTLEFRPIVRGSRINPLLRQHDPESPGN
jgi:hypothetical protein